MITNVSVGDKIMAIEVDLSLGDYEAGDIIEIVANSNFDAYLQDGEVEIEAFTTSMHADSNRKLFVPVDTIRGQGWHVTPQGELKVDAYFLDGNKTITGQQLKESLNDKFGKLGVARPVLETRKVGKNRIELVDKGFPNALWEIARLMTHAQEVKGYKDHDWKNLPIDVFPAAASRHRMKHNMGDIFDDEFEGLEMRHKVNEAFNVLAELELMITK